MTNSEHPDFIISNIKELEEKLNISSENARKNRTRYTHEEVFSEAYKRLNQSS